MVTVTGLAVAGHQPSRLSLPLPRRACQPPPGRTLRVRVPRRLGTRQWQPCWSPPRQSAQSWHAPAPVPAQTRLVERPRVQTGQRLRLACLGGSGRRRRCAWHVLGTPGAPVLQPHPPPRPTPAALPRCLPRATASWQSGRQPCTRAPQIWAQVLVPRRVSRQPLPVTRCLALAHPTRHQSPRRGPSVACGGLAQLLLPAWLRPRQVWTWCRARCAARGARNRVARA